MAASKASAYNMGTLLLDLLNRAHATNDIESAKAILSSSLPSIAPVPFNESTQAELEHNFEPLLLRVLQRNRETNASVDKQLNDVGLVLDMSIWCGDNAYTTTGVLMTVINDMIDCQTINESEITWALLEQRTSKIAPLVVGQRRHMNAILTKCSELKRRLSRSTNARFRGRVAMLLASVLPLTERSGLNEKGDHNVNTVTAIAAMPEDEEQRHKILTSITDVKPISGAKIHVDWKFYNTFWSMQKFLQNPALCFEGNNWKTVTDGIDICILAFNDHAIVREDAVLAKNMYSYSSDVPFTKYLTDPDLLQLQLSDPIFRRHMLTQFLILFQSIRVLAESNAANVSYTGERKQQVLILTKGARSMLLKTPVHATDFTNSVFSILKRENNWIKWKQEGCKSFEKEPADLAALTPMDSSADNTESKPRKKIPGSLRKVFMPPNPEAMLAELRDSSRMAVPQLDNFLSVVIEEMDSAEEDEMRYYHNKTFCWKAMRLLSRQKLDYCSILTQPNKTLEDVTKQYLENKKNAPAVNTVAEEEDTEADVQTPSLIKPGGKRTIEETAESAKQGATKKVKLMPEAKEKEKKEKEGESESITIVRDEEDEDDEDRADDEEGRGRRRLEREEEEQKEAEGEGEGEGEGGEGREEEGERTERNREEEEEERGRGKEKVDAEEGESKEKEEGEQEEGESREKEEGEREEGEAPSDGTPLVGRRARSLAEAEEGEVDESAANDKSDSMDQS